MKKSDMITKKSDPITSLFFVIISLLFQKVKKKFIFFALRNAPFFFGWTDFDAV